MTTKRWLGLFLLLVLLSVCLYELTTRGLQFIALRQRSPSSPLRIAMVFPAQLPPHGLPSAHPSAYVSRPQPKSQDSVSFVVSPVVSVDEPSLLHPAEEPKPDPEPFGNSNVLVGCASPKLCTFAESMTWRRTCPAHSSLWFPDVCAP